MVGVRLAAMGRDRKRVVERAGGDPASARFGWLAAIVLPLVLLVAVPASLWHGDHDHEHEHECAVCHAAHQPADLAGSAEVPPTRVPERNGFRREVRWVFSRRALRRPARAPPA